jgi:CheY-like chemotaxis protein
MKKILIAEDDAATRNILEQIFKQQGFDVLTANDGDGVVITLQHEIVDILLTDINMPVSIQNVIDKIKALAPNLPIIAITGENITSRNTDRRVNIFDEVVQKPVVINNLLELITKYTTTKTENSIILTPETFEGLECVQCGNNYFLIKYDFKVTVRGIKKTEEYHICTKCKHRYFAASSAVTIENKRIGAYDSFTL